MTLEVCWTWAVHFGFPHKVLRTPCPVRRKRGKPFANDHGDFARVKVVGFVAKDSQAGYKAKGLQCVSAVEDEDVCG